MNPLGVFVGHLWGFHASPVRSKYTTNIYIGPKNRGFTKSGVPFGDPHNRDHSILGSVLRSPYLGKLPNL